MSPSIQDYHIYCDETYPRGQVAFALGGLICTPRRSEILREKLSKVRQNFDSRGEVKWNKVSSRSLQVSEQFLNVFLDDPYARYSLMKVKKGVNWNAWGESEEERFFKTYYVYLMLNAGPFSRYYVYPDEQSLQKKYRWDTLHYLINRSRRYNWGVRYRNIRELIPLDSHKEDLLQLTDLLLGSLTSAAGAKAKSKLRQLISTHIESQTISGKPKIYIQHWTPRNHSG